VVSRTVRSNHPALRETKNFQTVRAEIHDVFAHNESGAFCFGVHLCEFFAAMATEGRKVVALNYVQLFWIGFTHRTSGSYGMGASTELKLI